MANVRLHRLQIHCKYFVLISVVDGDRYASDCVIRPLFETHAEFLNLELSNWSARVLAMGLDLSMNVHKLGDKK